MVFHPTPLFLVLILTYAQYLQHSQLINIEEYTGHGSTMIAHAPCLSQCQPTIMNISGILVSVSFT